MDKPSHGAGEHQGGHHELIGFFSGLKPAIAAAEAAQAELDRHLATRWSVFTDFFHFIYKKENTLSRLFRTLLDPAGTHGQGAKFLEALLEEIRDKLPAEGDEMRWPSADPGCKAYTEYATPKGRSIDIVIEWPGGDYWIGIENKPWAAEQPDQIHDYFKALLAKVSHRDDAINRVLVLYVSGTGHPPTTTEGLCPKELDRCITLSYRARPDGPSVEGWLARCKTVCEAERIRWFLAEIERYVQRSFHSIHTEHQTRRTDMTVIKFIQEGGEETAKLALLVADAVSSRKKEIMAKTFQQVKAGLEKPDLGSGWCWGERIERLFLHRRGREDWDATENHGVWVVWDLWDPDWKPGIWVGVEWPLSAENLSKEKIHGLFPEHARTSGKQADQKQEGRKKEWFAIHLLGWNSLLTKSIDKIADETVKFMQELTKKIDELDP